MKCDCLGPTTHIQYVWPSGLNAALVVRRLEVGVPVCQNFSFSSKIIHEHIHVYMPPAPRELTISCVLYEVSYIIDLSLLFLGLDAAFLLTLEVILRL